MATKNKPGYRGLNRRQALACTPIRNPEVEEERKADGILLRYPVEVKPWFQSIFKRLSRRDSNIIIRRLQLDTLGSSVWQMVDGKQTVADIAEQFRKTHQLGSREAELSVTAFLKDLGRRGLIALKEEGSMEQPLTEPGRRS
jgi:hypothetical protein